METACKQSKHMRLVAEMESEISLYFLEVVTVIYGRRVHEVHQEGNKGNWEKLTQENS